MTKEDLNFIKDAFSQIIDDIAGNPDWGDAAKAVASDLGTLERKLEKRVTELSSNLDEAAEAFNREDAARMWDYGGKTEGEIVEAAFKAGANWREAQIPKLPDNVDEAADTFSHNGDVNGVGGEDYEDDLRITFKAGAECMAGQFHFVTAHCCESSNPASESVDKPLHLITLIYEDDNKNPYVVGGDNVEICLRKK